MHWTQLIKDVSIILTVVGIVVVYNWAPHWTSKCVWTPKSLWGQTLFLLGLLGLILVYFVSSYFVYRGF